MVSDVFMGFPDNFILLDVVIKTVLNCRMLRGDI